MFRYIKDWWRRKASIETNVFFELGVIVHVSGMEIDPSIELCLGRRIIHIQLSSKPSVMGAAGREMRSYGFVYSPELRNLLIVAGRHGQLKV